MNKSPSYPPSHTMGYGPIMAFDTVPEEKAAGTGTKDWGAAKDTMTWSAGKYGADAASRMQGKMLEMFLEEKLSPEDLAIAQALMESIEDDSDTSSEPDDTESSTAMDSRPRRISRGAADSGFAERYPDAGRIELHNPGLGAAPAKSRQRQLSSAQAKAQEDRLSGLDRIKKL